MTHTAVVLQVVINSANPHQRLDAMPVRSVRHAMAVRHGHVRVLHLGAVQIHLKPTAVVVRVHRMQHAVVHRSLVTKGILQTAMVAHLVRIRVVRVSLHSLRALRHAQVQRRESIVAQKVQYLLPPVEDTERINIPRHAVAQIRVRTCVRLDIHASPTTIARLVRYVPVVVV